MKVRHAGHRVFFLRRPPKGASRFPFHARVEAKASGSVRPVLLYHAARDDGVILAKGIGLAFFLFVSVPGSVSAGNVRPRYFTRLGAVFPVDLQSANMVGFNNLRRG